MWESHQRGAAARDEAEEQVVFAKVAREGKSFFPCEQAVSIGDGVSARLEVESVWELDGSHFWDEQAAGCVKRKQVRHRLGHGRASLPQPQDADPPDFIQWIFALIDEEGIAFALDEA